MIKIFLTHFNTRLGSQSSVSNGSWSPHDRSVNGKGSDVVRISPDSARTPDSRSHSDSGSIRSSSGHITPPKTIDRSDAESISTTISQVVIIILVFVFSNTIYSIILFRSYRTRGALTENRELLNLPELSPKMRLLTPKMDPSFLERSKNIQPFIRCKGILDN